VGFGGTKLFVLQNELDVNSDIKDEDHVTCFVVYVPSEMISDCFNLHPEASL
jgi:hypothetical protein